MPDDDVVPDDLGWLDDAPKLSPLLPGGEAITAYIDRSIVGDTTLKSLSSQAGQKGVDVQVRRHFRPAAFAQHAIEEHYTAFARLKWAPERDRLQRLVDHFWSPNSTRALALDLRMAMVPEVDLGEIPDLYKTPPFSMTERLRVVRQAAARRDRLISQLCNELQTGRWLSSGHIPTDHFRASIPIASAWWADSAMECAWRDSELRPREGASPGTPTFHGVSLMSAAVVNPPQAKGADPVSNAASDWMRANVLRPKQWKRDAALRQCMDDTGCVYRDALAAWGALPEEIRGKRGGHK